MKRAYDVAHSSELISDTHPILLAAEYGNPEYVERAMATARVMRDTMRCFERVGRVICDGD